MPFRFSGWELIIVLVIILLLFGPGRIAKVAGELGKGIRSFKDSVNASAEEDDEEQPKEKAESGKKESEK
jgi:sec-independent protein translocase protein TatA